MKFPRLLTVLTLVVALVLSPLGFSEIGGGSGGAHVVSVDCNNGESIENALGKKPQADELIIEINGMCQENVVVERDSVTLRGGNPNDDGIIGQVTEFPPNNTLNIVKSRFVTIENLTITGGEFNGALVWYSGVVSFSNCRLINNAFRGARILHSSSTIFRDTVFSGNGVAGLWAGSSTVICRDCTVTDNPGAASGTGFPILLFQSSVGEFTNLTISGDYFALWAIESSTASVDGAGSSLSTEPGSGATLIFSNNSRLRFFSGSFIGPLWLFESQARLRSVNQTVPGGYLLPNNLKRDSNLDAELATSLDGDLWLSDFSGAMIRDTSQVSGGLLCSTGGDAWCDNIAADNVLGGSNCGQCP